MSMTLLGFAAPVFPVFVQPWTRTQSFSLHDSRQPPVSTSWRQLLSSSTRTSTFQFCAGRPLFSGICRSSSWQCPILNPALHVSAASLEVVRDGFTTTTRSEERNSLKAIPEDVQRDLSIEVLKKTTRRSKSLSKALKELHVSEYVTPIESSVTSVGTVAFLKEIDHVTTGPSLKPATTKKPKPRAKKSQRLGKAPVKASRKPRDAEEMTRVYVLDTNVILHDSNSLFHFGKHDVVLPITVLEELDKFKKGNEVINFHAREFLRRVDELTSGEFLFGDTGVPLGKGLGKIKVVIKGRVPYSSSDNLFHQVFHGDCPDHRILEVVHSLAIDRAEAAKSQGVSVDDYQKALSSVILVSKDVNLRMKARALGLSAQDYVNDSDIKTESSMYTGKRVIENAPVSVVDALYRAGVVAESELSHLLADPTPNENFIVKCGGSKSVLATYRSQEQCYVRVTKEPASRISPKNAEQAFALSALLNPEISLVTVAGSAGTGKTLLALAAALQQQHRYQQIYLARPIVPLSNRDIGYLPGDMNAKIDPYMQPLYDNLGVIKHQLSNEKDADSSKPSGKKKEKAGEKQSSSQHIKELLDSEKLVITPLAYIRGRSFQEVFFIVDEAQNLTPHEIKTIITRAGEGTKIIFTGDVQQIDTPYLDRISNGLSYLINRMTGQPLYAHITLEKGERSTLAKIATELL
mmetsp:Transcript_24560/g.42249  ORF Transcript_24560/g.42249 Transcript_24560/m.42249 type:complete len:691 (-) Transcript_24560:798-2870(-)|eukprot:CAMPEP_0196652422 /NCGR_PEP_ID=MMETSP1086-20130531/1701_1 /TAXON_ID=77921 /ORGANISM="Cyanoptyche  gloeocystis , Strain SAG4.97" /LENGTH=690 /DNA_ID=CAMNT_0041982957 /DNA_START=126 /DNA_END=2198 /DNA_ORIENTATION=+